MQRQGIFAKAGVLGEHKAINHSLSVNSGDLHTNKVECAFSLLKRASIGTWHKVSAKYLEAYLDEMSFRFNNRTITIYSAILFSKCWKQIT